MHVYATSVPCQFDISKTASNCNMEVYQKLSASSNDVMNTSLPVKTLVAATCQDRRNTWQIQYTVVVKSLYSKPGLA